MALGYFPGSFIHPITSFGNRHPDMIWSEGHNYLNCCCLLLQAYPFKKQGHAIKEAPSKQQNQNKTRKIPDSAPGTEQYLAQL